MLKTILVGADETEIPPRRTIIVNISFIPTFDFFSNWLLSALNSICLPPFVLFSL